jgi:hypothetical protein
MAVGGGIGCGGEMGCSWVLYIGRRRLAKAAEERSRWRPVECNGAAVSSLESAPRGRGNRGAVLLQKGKWRRCSTRRQPARRVVMVWHQTGGGRQRRSGLSGLQRPVGPDDRVGQFQKWKTKVKMELGWAARDIWAEFKSGHREKLKIVCSNFCFKEMGFKSKVLNISKPNLN